YNALHPGPEPERMAPFPGLDVVPLRSRLGILSPMLTHQSGRPLVQAGRLRALLENGRFDVVHFHNVSLLGGPGLLSVGRGLKVYEAHEHWLVCPTHVLWRHNREPCAGRQCVRCVLHYHRPPQLWRYTGMLERHLAHIDLFIAKSEFSRRKHAEFDFPREMEVLPYFLPADEIPAPAPEPSPHRQPYFLFVGRLERIKGLDDVIPVFRHYEGADLLVAGEGEHGARLRKMSRDIPRVRFLGRVSQADLARYYRHAVALIVPSLGFETFGIVLIEAFQHSTPVIARRIGPFPEIVERCGGGELFADVNELVAAMHRLQDDPALRPRMAARARQGFVENWSERAVVPRYLELVQRSLEVRAPSPSDLRTAGSQ
ncbi:MAG: glycosyltransferase family 4 protein, partial [Actinomycetota bacterium]|nr:glycosyltransferase family 4 protein [Actinomycetota bacterium]